VTIPDERTDDDTFDALTWSVDCDLLPEGYREPKGYRITRTGIWQQREDPRTGTQETRVAYAPIVPIGVLIDPTGAQILQLAWLDGVKWITKVVPRSVAKSGRKLIAVLGDAGLPAVEGDAKGLERWLATVENCNRAILPRRNLARWLGWQPNGTFLASSVGADIEPSHPEQLAALGAHRTSGTLLGWQEGVRVIERLPVAKMALYAGLAAPLLDVLNVDSFVMDISGSSTRGKTTAAKIGLSCWADPSEKGDGTFSWRTTMIAIEKRLNLVRGLPVLLDETRVVKTPEMVNDVLYQVSKNHGAARGGGYPSLLAWSTIVISTGEQPALSFTTHQGASARVLTITRPPFGHGTTENGDAAVTVGRAVDENYGHAGPAFVERLQRELQGGKAALVRRHRALAASLRGATDLSGRRAPLIACLALAAQLAHEWGILPGLTAPKLEVWQGLFAGEDPTDNRPEMALDAAMEYVASNGNAIWHPGGSRNPPLHGWIGRVVELVDESGDKTLTVGLMPIKLKAALERAGIGLDTVLAAWKENGWLVKGKEKGHEWDEKKKVDGKNVRLLVFSGTVTAGSDFEPRAEQSRFSGHSAYLDAA
jgi:hypothetical protein